MLFGRNDGINTDTMVTLTEQGRKQADEGNTAPFRILEQLFERSPQSVKEISRNTGLPVDQVKGWLKSLNKRGDVRVSVIGE